MTPHLALIVGSADDASALRRAAILPALAAAGRVSVLSAVDSGHLPAVGRPGQWVLPLISYPERRLLRSLRAVIDRSPAPLLPILAEVERRAALRLRPAWDRDEVAEVLDLLHPSLIVNCSPQVLPAADLPLRLARERGIPTAACIRSGGDLLSRTHLITLYDLFVVPDRPTRERLLGILPGLAPSRIVGGDADDPGGGAEDAAAYRALAAWWSNGFAAWRGNSRGERTATA